MKTIFEQVLHGKMPTIGNEEHLYDRLSASNKLAGSAFGHLAIRIRRKLSGAPFTWLQPARVDSNEILVSYVY